MLAFVDARWPGLGKQAKILTDKQVALRSPPFRRGATHSGTVSSLC
jgi:hypothetical protein